MTQILIGKDFLIKLAKDEKRINHNNLFFSIDDNSVVKDADFLKEIGTLQIKVKNKKKKIFAEQENVLSNAEMLLEKRNEWIGQSRKNNKIANDEKFYDAPEKSEESISEKSEQKSDQSVLKWVQVSKDRFNFKKLKINMNKDLAIMIDNKRYILNDANELVNKIAEQKMVKIMSLKHAIIW